MKSLTRLLSFALLAVLGSASAQSITSVTSDGMNPSQGSLGTKLTIVGTGLGGPTTLGKPKVFLSDPVTAKTFALKLVTNTDTQITALVTKATYGALDVNVLPKGGTLLTATGAFTVPALQVSGADATGTIGNTISISGSGLLGVVKLSKPKVQLFDTATNKKYTLKVLTFTDSLITASISKAVAGTMQLQLIPKGGATVVAEPSFVVPLPNISLISPTFGLANDPIALTCQHVGSKKPKVKLGNKSCKVTAFTDTSVNFLMPKKLAKGVQTLQLINGVGTATQIAAIINEGDAPDTSIENLLTATAGKIKFVAGGGLIFDVATTYESGPPAVISTNGYMVNPSTFVTQYGMTLLTPFNPATFVQPIAFVDDPDGKVELQIPPTEIFGDPAARWSSDAPGGSYTITVLSVESVDEGGTPATLVRGAFTATLKLVQGAGTDTLVISNGLFRTTFATPP